MIKKILPLCVSLALTACAIGPDYTRPKMDLPSQWQNLPADAQAKNVALAQDWWKSFNDPVLDQLETEALQYNQNLAVAVARVEKAQAQAGVALANMLPALNASGGYQRARSSSEMIAPGAPQISDVRQANGTLSWELDLWGKLRRANEAAKADLLANEFNREAFVQSLTAQVAETYFQLRALDAQVEIAKSTLIARESSLKIMKKRLDGGIISELDYRQAEAQTAAARAAVPQLEQSQSETEGALSVLIGQSPRVLFEQGVKRGKALAQLTVSPVVPEGLPSDLLTRRPDVMAAEASLKAANARIGVARAAYLPSISLTGALGSESLSMANLFSGPARTWSFIGNLAMPIFDWGKTQAGVDMANADQKAALAQYKLAIQNAFSDTRSALSAVSSSTKVELAQQEQYSAMKKALHLAQLRYDNGYSSYLEVLTAEQGSYQAEIQLIDAQMNRLNASVNLIKALGGGWHAKQAL